MKPITYKELLAAEAGTVFQIPYEADYVKGSPTGDTFMVRELTSSKWFSFQHYSGRYLLWEESELRAAQDGIAYCLDCEIEK